jgi:hypothetical protein
MDNQLRCSQRYYSLRDIYLSRVWGLHITVYILSLLYRTSPFFKDRALCPITSIRPNMVPLSIATFLQLPRYVHGPPEHSLVQRSLLLTCPLASLYHC